MDVSFQQNLLQHILDLLLVPAQEAAQIAF